MKAYSITFQTILNALKRRWKAILAWTLAFALLGAAAGWFFRGRGMAEPGGSAQPLKAVDFSALPRTQNYYTACLTALNSGADGLNLYLSVVSGNANPRKEPSETLEALDAVETELSEFRAVRIVPLQSVLNEAGAVIVPAEFLDGMADRCARELASLRMDLIAAEAATETIRQMDAPDYDGGFSGSYGNLLALASQYPTMLRTQAVTEKSLDRLQNHMSEVQAEGRRIERELEAAAGELNALLERFTGLADEIAKEDGLIFTPTFENDRTSDVVVTHGHRASSAQESFAVIVLFCVLVGLCSGAFLAVCREAAEEKKALSAQPPA